MKTAVITGANGFVGSWLAKNLLQKGVKVFAIVRNEKSQISRLEKTENLFVIYNDMDDVEELSEKISESVDVFFHFAWEASAGEQRGDYEIQLNNVNNTCKAVRVAHKIGCKKFIMASSIMEKECTDVMEAGMEPGKPYIYATAKLAANYMAKIEANSLGINYNAGIISNIYGVGEISPRLINSSIKKLIKGERASFSPGEQMYDFIYVEDAAEAFYQIAEKGKNNKNYYIGSREPRKLKEFLMEMRDVVSPDIEIGLGDYEYKGVSLDYTSIDVNMLYEDTGFEPQYSFAEGILKTKNWLENYLNKKEDNK